MGQSWGRWPHSSRLDRENKVKANIKMDTLLPRSHFDIDVVISAILFAVDDGSFMPNSYQLWPIYGMTAPRYSLKAKSSRKQSQTLAM